MRNSDSRAETLQDELLNETLFTSLPPAPTNSDLNNTWAQGHSGLDLWAYLRGVTLDFLRPGKPTENAYIKAFNGRFPTKCLKAYCFLSLADAQEKVDN